MGKPLTAEHKRKIGNANRGNIFSPNAKFNMSLGQTGKTCPKRTSEQVERLRQSQLKIREHYSQKSKEQWSDPEMRNKMTKAILAGSHIRPNKTEYNLGKLINIACPNEYKYTGDGSHIINGICPDFTNVNGQKKVIELFGDYWHSEEVRGHSVEEEEQSKRDKYAELGFSCLIIWERELKEKSKAELVAIIKIFNGKSNNHANKILPASLAVEQQLGMF